MRKRKTKNWQHNRLRQTRNSFPNRPFFLRISRLIKIGTMTTVVRLLSFFGKNPPDSRFESDVAVNQVPEQPALNVDDEEEKDHSHGKPLANSILNDFQTLWTSFRLKHSLKTTTWQSNVLNLKRFLCPRPSKKPKTVEKSFIRPIQPTVRTFPCKTYFTKSLLNFSFTGKQPLKRVVFCALQCWLQSAQKQSETHVQSRPVHGPFFFYDEHLTQNKYLLVVNCRQARGLRAKDIFHQFHHKILNSRKWVYLIVFLSN